MPIDYGTQVYGNNVYGYDLYGGENISDIARSGTPKHRTEQWEECSRCGFFYPLSQLRKQQGDGGMATVCTVIPCYDEQSHGDYEASMRKPVEPPLKFVDN